MIQVEVCVNSIHSALNAQKAGACRVELCDNLKEGGTTPAHSLIEKVRKLLSIQLFVIIRPRGGDFLYDDLEFEMMKASVHYCGQLGCDGVVLGMLRADGTIDCERIIELVNIAKQYKMETTFHRAFDRTNNLFEALEEIIAIGCKRVLTSGGYDTALEGKEVLKALLAQAEERIIVMPGSGITPSNIAELVATTHLKEFHGTFSSIAASKMNYINDSMTDDNSVLISDITKIKNALIQANNKPQKNKI